MTNTAARLALYALLALTAPLCAAEPPAKASAAKRAASAEDVNLKISFKMRSGPLERSGNFVVQAGSQGNYTSGGSNPVEAGSKESKTVEFKKYGAIVNALPVINPNKADTVRAEIQFELSGPLQPPSGSKINPIATFQLQTSFEAELGKTLVLVDEPDRRIEVRVERAP